MIRPIVATDWSGILQVQAQAYTQVPTEQLTVLQSKWRSAPDSCLVAVNEQDKCLAYLLAHPWQGSLPPKLFTAQQSYQGPDLYLHDLAVATSARGLGLGRQLVQALLALAQQQGVGQLSLVAVQDSVDFWAQFGFVPRHTQRVDTSYGEGALWMSHLLSL